jgi:hypothetical protein
MLDDLYGPVSIASSGQHLYFVEVGDNIPQGGGRGWLSRVPTSKSCTQRSCFDVIDPLVLTGELQGQYIYETHVAFGPNDVCLTQSYNATPDHSIECFDLVDFQKRVLESGAGYVTDLWGGASVARWAMGSTTSASTDGEVRGRPLVGGPVSTLASGRMGTSSVASDGTSTYFTESQVSATQGAPFMVYDNDHKILYASIASDRAIKGTAIGPDSQGRPNILRVAIRRPAR